MFKMVRASSSHYSVETMALAVDAARQYAAIPPGLLTEAVVIVDVPPDRHEDGTGDRGGSGCKGWAAAVSLCNPPQLGRS